MIQAAIIALLLAQAAQAPAEESARERPLALIEGDWQVANSNTGEVVMDCAHAQRFEVTQDRRNVILTELGIADLSMKYMVLHSEPDRILMFIEDEDRMTEEGDPIIWWAYFNGEDEFRWRRYDWRPGDRTALVWTRCPQG